MFVVTPVFVPALQVEVNLDEDAADTSYDARNEAQCHDGYENSPMGFASMTSAIFSNGYSPESLRPASE